MTRKHSNVHRCGTRPSISETLWSFPSSANCTRLLLATVWPYHITRTMLLHAGVWHHTAVQLYSTCASATSTPRPATCSCSHHQPRPLESVQSGHFLKYIHSNTGIQGMMPLPSCKYWTVLDQTVIMTKDLSKDQQRLLHTHGILDTSNTV